MQVKLISYSQDPAGRNLLEQIAYCARVSNPGNQHNDETAERLVRYLMKHKHWSPFEMSSICLEVSTTRDIARQILRHRSFSFQEFSQRYAEPELDGLRAREPRLQDTKNRQNSIETNDVDLMELWNYDQWVTWQTAVEGYKRAINAGIAKEQARALLPEGLTPSTMYMNGTVRSWIHYIDLRSGPETQKEHREVARACAEAIRPVFPMITEFVNES